MAKTVTPKTESDSQQSESYSLVLVESGAVFKGEQEFVVTRSAINLEKPGKLSKERVLLLEKVLHPSRFKGRSVLDVSSQPGYFFFNAIQNGAASATAIDVNDKYLALIEEASKHLGFDNVATAATDLSAWSSPADIVLALNSQRWLENFEGDEDALDKRLAKLASLTGYMIIVEATSANFESALRKHFRRIEPVGEADGHALYLAFHCDQEIDLTCPLPEFAKAGKLISCRRLVEFAGLEYWSRVYDGDGVIYKQTTRELTERENAMLGKLTSKHFPRVREVLECGDSSILVLEKIIGSNLLDARSTVTNSLKTFTNFASSCLQILLELQSAGITHRDIQMGNLLLRDGLPVLLDFGWAVTENLPMFLPPGLLSITPDGQACDVYSMGKLLCELGQEKYPELLCIFELMTEPDPAARVNNASDLIEILQLVGSVGEVPEASKSNSLVLKLIENLKINRARLTAAHADFANLEEKTRLAQDHRLAVLQMEYEKVVSEITNCISELKRVIGEKDELLVLLDERQKLIEGITQSQAWRLANQLQKSKKSFGSMFGKTP